jgi:hypothetical protein
MTDKKPRSWKDVEALPYVAEIQRDEGDDSPSVFIWLEDAIDNPVTGETGGGFFVGGFKDFLDHYDHGLG